MILKKLFTDAFPGDTLTSNAINESATRTTDEIHEFIQSGVDEKVLEKESKINFTSTSPAQNYDFLSQSVNLNTQRFNLDVDGDGSVTALGDGLMVIRKLFGTAFAGDALTSKAISNNATRTTDEIHEYIAAMIDVSSAAT